MKHTPASFLLSSALILSAFATTAAAKDKPITLDECPAPVKATIQHYAAQGTFESVALDEKKKSGGSAVYEAKFNLSNGRRVEVHISPEGKVVLFEEKKRKN